MPTIAVPTAWLASAWPTTLPSPSSASTVPPALSVSAGAARTHDTVDRGHLVVPAALERHANLLDPVAGLGHDESDRRALAVCAEHPAAGDPQCGSVTAVVRAVGVADRGFGAELAGHHRVGEAIGRRAPSVALAVVAVELADVAPRMTTPSLVVRRNSLSSLVPGTRICSAVRRGHGHRSSSPVLMLLARARVARARGGDAPAGLSVLDRAGHGETRERPTSSAATSPVASTRRDRLLRRAMRTVRSCQSPGRGDRSRRRGRAGGSGGLVRGRSSFDHPSELLEPTVDQGRDGAGPAPECGGDVDVREVGVEPHDERGPLPVGERVERVGELVGFERGARARVRPSTRDAVRARAVGGASGTRSPPRDGGTNEAPGPGSTRRAAGRTRPAPDPGRSQTSRSSGSRAGPSRAAGRGSTRRTSSARWPFARSATSGRSDSPRLTHP